MCCVLYQRISGDETSVVQSVDHRNRIGYALCQQPAQPPARYVGARNSVLLEKILRLGIILYGFRLTFQDVVAVGLPAILIDAIIVTITILLGVQLGKWLKMDRSIALLTSIGSGICGAAAILGAESTIHSKPYKTAVAVSTVVIFGTLSMFLYPILYRNGVLSLSSDQMGLYIGSTLHEVAHVVGAGNALGEEVSGSAIIVKMIRVMMLVPVLLIVGYSVSAVRAANRKRTGRKPVAAGAKGRLAIPWFALGFLAVIAFNSFDLLPHSLVNFINTLDTFLLTMAMTALGAETSIENSVRQEHVPLSWRCCSTCGCWAEATCW